MNKKRGFTLAETLTVLMVIGFIAVVLIPTLNANIEKQKKESALKRLYSSFSINIKTVLGESNCSSISCLRAYPDGMVWYKQNEVSIVDADGKGEHKEYAKERGHVFANPKYFQVTSDCNHCLPENTIFPTMTSDNIDTERPKYKLYRLNNAALMALYNFGDPDNPQQNCSNTDYLGVYDAAGKRISGITTCGIVVFDVNGEKGPNRPGQDLFAFFIADEPIDNSYLVPMGYIRGVRGNSTYNKDGRIDSYVGTCKKGEACYDEARKVCSTSENHRQGYNCTAQVMIDGWKIKY
ncbi:MAG: type II secretion system GspH family protein [bacterium]|nr:type II secretion system GspH family protein [bacterium]